MTDAIYPWLIEVYNRDPDSLARQVDQVPRDKIAIFWSLEYMQPEVWQQLMAQFDRGLEDIWLLPSSHGLQDQVPEYAGRTLFVDFDLHILRLHMQHWSVVGFNPRWDWHSGRSLLLTGNAYHASRARLLWKLERRSCLTQVMWSMKLPDQRSKTWAHQVLPELSASELDQWQTSMTRNLDGVWEDTCQGRAREGDIFDWRLYRDTAMRIICETNVDTASIVTEKTWQTVANRHPFLTVAARPGSLRHLHERGFRCFTEYLPCADYDEIQDLDQRLDAIITNMQAFLAVMPHRHREITADIEHNFQQLIRCMHQEWHTIQNVHARLGTDVPAHRLIPLYRDRAAWWQFYYNVRADSWPDCDNEQDFSDLPLAIQQELIERGYEPRYPDKVDWIN